jgi:hypothetical protein
MDDLYVPFERQLSQSAVVVAAPALFAVLVAEYEDSILMHPILMHVLSIIAIGCCCGDSDLLDRSRDVSAEPTDHPSRRRGSAGMIVGQDAAQTFHERVAQHGDDVTAPERGVRFGFAEQVLVLPLHRSAKILACHAKVEKAIQIVHVEQRQADLAPHVQREKLGRSASFGRSQAQTGCLMHHNF